MSRKKRRQKQEEKRKLERTDRKALDAWADRAAAETDAPRTGLDEGRTTPPVSLGDIAKEYAGR